MSKTDEIGYYFIILNLKYIFLIIVYYIFYAVIHSYMLWLSEFYRKHTVKQAFW